MAEVTKERLLEFQDHLAHCFLLEGRYACNLHTEEPWIVKLTDYALYHAEKERTELEKFREWLVHNSASPDDRKHQLWQLLDDYIENPEKLK